MQSTRLLMMMTTAAIDCQYIRWNDQFYCIEHDERATGTDFINKSLAGYFFHTPIFLYNSIRAYSESSNKWLTKILEVEIALKYWFRETPKG